MAGARVSLSGEGDPACRADDRGRVALPHIRPGDHVVEATADGGAAQARVHIAPGGTTSVVLVVAPSAEAAAATGTPSGPDAGRLFGPSELRDRPRPSDVWSFVRDVPGVVLDRVDVGGSETAQQSLVVSRGDPGSGAVWTLDGADVTDPAAIGASALFADTDALGAIAVRASTLDARVRTAGVQVGLFTPPASARWGGSAHLAATGPQSDNLPGALSDRPLPRARTGRALDAGAQAGGPLGGRAWVWAAAGLDRLRQRTVAEHDETLRVGWLSARGLVRVGEGRLSLLGVRSEKVHDDRDPTASAEEPARWRQSGPTHLLALEDVRAWGRLSVLTRASLLDSGFALRPQGGSTADAYEDFRGIFRRSFQTFETDRPRLQAGTEVAASGRALGFEHRAAAGAGYRRSTVTTESRWPGNQVLGLERQTVFFRTFRLTGFAQPTRAQNARSVHEQVELWVQDEARRGRLTTTLGLRLDRLWGRNLATRVGANPTFPDLLPTVAYGGGPTSIRWVDLLPRAGLGFDLRRDATLVARAGYGAYGAALGAGDVTFDNPVGQGASVTFYWLDANGDHSVQRAEIDRARGRLGSSGIVPDAPGVARSPHAVSPALESPRTHEAFLGLERRGARLSGDVRVSWRRLLEPSWRPLAGLTLTDYVARGRVQGELFGEPYDVVFFAPASTSRIVPGNGRVLANRRSYFQDAWTFESTVLGRLGGLEWSAWGTLLDWREYFDDIAISVQDPTPTESEPLRDGGPVAARSVGLTRDAFVNARWTAGAAAAAPLVAGVKGALRLHARDGFPIPYFQVASTGDPTAGSKNVLVTPQLDTYRLPGVLLLDLRLSRDFALPGGRLTTSVDVFNATDAADTLQVARDVELPAFGRPRDLVRPRILRFGLEYRFGGGRRVQ